MIPLSLKRLNNLVAIIVGIIIAKTVVLSQIAQELKDYYSSGTEDSKIKRIRRFLSNKSIKPEKLYEFYIYKFLKKYKNTSNSVCIIFDHTNIQNKFVILQFSLKAGKRAIPLWYKVFLYKEEGNKDFKHIKEGLRFLHSVILPKYQVTLLADRGFKSIDLFKFIDEELNWNYCIRCTKDLGITIDGKPKIKKLEDIVTLKGATKYFYNIKLTSQNYICNMAVCKAIGEEDTWFIANNLNKSLAIREYKKRFQIEEMFKDFKSGGFNLESTLSMDIQYIRMLYLCISIAYCWIITLGVSCRKDKKNKLIGATKTLKGQQVRIYSLFKSGVKWFKRCYYSSRNDYHLKFCFTLYES